MLDGNKPSDPRSIAGLLLLLPPLKFTGWSREGKWINGELVNKYGQVINRG